MKKILTFCAALVCGLAMNARTIYLNTGGASLWESDGAHKFAVWHWQGSGEGQWTGWMTSLGNNIWSVDIPDSSNQVIFCRFNNAASSPSWGADMWNQTDDLEPGSNNLYTIIGWGIGDWSTYSGGGGTDPVTPPVNPGVEGNPRYYYKGYIDGQDVEPGEETLFDHGIAELEVSDNAYIFVLYQVDGYPGVQYMTASYVDGPTHATLLSNGGEKFHIGAGSYNLYLYDNEDGTLEISTQVIPGKKLADPQPVQQGIEDVEANEKAHKLFIDGQLRIVRGDKVFDVTGRQL